MNAGIQRTVGACIIHRRWISKLVHFVRNFGESRPAYDGVKVQESRMRENIMYGLTSGVRETERWSA